ncbi:hypothetical protein EH223_20470 [candidate division KSB1 bacterium]|nr:hypothetical protein [candidate division KSB1 bacterium]RQV99878.1 MAG: hypothetical protein EH223_20470 [candidate division KSB1 bacterium]
MSAVKDSIKIPGYKNIEWVGAGPYWTLYDAVRIYSGTRHLLQVLDASVAYDEKFVSLFKGLLPRTSILRHENILVPHDYEETSEYKFFIYKYFYSQSLQSVLDAHIPLLERRVITIIQQVTETLQFAQIRGLRHGWLSPHVVLLSRFNDEVKIFGFGSERLFTYLDDTQRGTTATGYACIPPENLALAANPIPDDAYALGVLFYQLLMGRSPFSKQNVSDLRQEKLSTITPPYKVNTKLSRQTSDLAMALLDPNPHLRANYSTILNVFSPQEDNIVPVDTPFFDTTCAMDKVRDFFSTVAPVSKKLVGSKKRIAYSTITILVLVVTLMSLAAFTHFSSRDAQRFQRIYDEFVAEERYNDNDISMVVSDNLSSETPQHEQSRKTERISSEKRSTNDVLTISTQHNAYTALHADNQKVSDLQSSASVDSKELSNDMSVKKEQGEETDENGSNSLFNFASVPFANKIRIGEENRTRNLPCDIELPLGSLKVTYIETKANFSWSTTVELSKSKTTILPSSEQVGTGDLTVILQEPAQYGYVYVKIDDEPEQVATPFRRTLSVGWHRVQIFRQNYNTLPADTSVFVRPSSEHSLFCKVL